ncbi:MAG: hypothetical protein EOO25_06770 [Comamonadaceae bacterium]|nr:MAG: hypothetical protein EOO25_06770 [Comamonadaceae bacterium]
MSEWWTYRPSDFLMFSPRTYWRMVELYNREVWPAHLLAMAGGLGAIALTAMRNKAASRAAALLLAPAWVWVGWAFHWERYASINWSAQYLAAAFLLQAALLLAVAAMPQGPATAPARSRIQHVGLVLALAGVLAYPLAGLAAGRPWSQSEVFGIAPDPTALATLGLLLATGPLQSRAAGIVLATIPVLSLLLGMATLWVMAG